MMSKRIELVSDRTYPFKIEQEKEGWSGSGFEREIIEMMVRMVDGKAQVELSIDRFKGGRRYSTVTGLELPSDIVARLIEALTQ